MVNWTCIMHDIQFIKFFLFIFFGSYTCIGFILQLKQILSEMAYDFFAFLCIKTNIVCGKYVYIFSYSLRLPGVDHLCQEPQYPKDIIVWSIAQLCQWCVCTCVFTFIFYLLLKHFVIKFLNKLEFIFEKRIYSEIGMKL